MTIEKTARKMYPAAMLPRKTDATIWPPSAPIMTPSPDTAENVPRRLIGNPVGHDRAQRSLGEVVGRLNQGCGDQDADERVGERQTDEEEAAGEGSDDDPRAHGDRIANACGRTTAPRSAGRTARRWHRPSTRSRSSRPCAPGRAQRPAPGRRTERNEPQMMKMPRLAGIIHQRSRRTPLIGVGGSSFPAASSMKASSASSSEGIVMGKPFIIFDDRLSSRRVKPYGTMGLISKRYSLLV